MKRTLKIGIFLAVLVLAFIMIPNMSNAAETHVTAADNLYEVVKNAADGDIIYLDESVELSKAIEVSGKTITINGQGNTITAAENMEHGDSSEKNFSIITATVNGKINLVDITLAGSPKYGVQAHNGAYVSLDGVTIENCLYAGVLVNAGTVEVIDLILNYNGSDVNKGIEISKGKGMDEEVVPQLIMNGTLTSTETENAVYLADDDYDTTTRFTIENTATTTNKVVIDGDKIAVLDEINNIIYVSAPNEKIEIAGSNTGTEYDPNRTVAIYIMGLEEPIQINVRNGEILVAEELAELIDLEALGMSNYTVEGFYTTDEYSEKFDFTQGINADTAIYAKLDSTGDNEGETTLPGEEVEGEKDETPNTGVENYIGIAALVAVVSLVSVIILKKRN